MTKETEKAFQILYCEYKRRRRAGIPKQDAVCFEDTTIGFLNAFSKWHPSDINHCLLELHRAKFISMNICGDVVLLEAGIEFMEDKPKEFFQSISGFFDLSAILGFITGI